MSECRGWYPVAPGRQKSPLAALSTKSGDWKISVTTSLTMALSRSIRHSGRCSWLRVRLEPPKEYR